MARNKRNRIMETQVILNGDLGGGWDTNFTQYNRYHVPLGWGDKSSTQDANNHTIAGVGPKGQPCIHMKSDGSSTWIRPISNGIHSSILNNHPGEYRYPHKLSNYAVECVFTQTVRLKANHLYRLELDIYEITAGDLRFERNTDTTATSQTFTTVGHKVYVFAGDNDRSITFIRGTFPTDLKFGNIKLYYLGPNTGA